MGASRTNFREPARVALLTEATRAHTHTAIFNDYGNGFTTPADHDGHFHLIRGCDVMPAGEGDQKHTHELSTERQQIDPRDLPSRAGPGPGRVRQSRVTT